MAKIILGYIVANWLVFLIGILALAVIGLALVLLDRESGYVARLRAMGLVIISKMKDFLTWDWTKKLLHWIIISAGTMSECVFLIASLWMSINANVHQFVLLFITEKTTTHLTELATTAYVALPECIVALAVVTTLSHIRMVLYSKDYRAIIWSVLYGLPTIVFVVLSLITLGSAVASATFQMPTPLVIVRALAGYMYAFTSLLYTQLGAPQEADRLSEKDGMLADLRRETDEKLATLEQEKTTMLADLRREMDEKVGRLEQENARLNALIADQKQSLQQQKRQQEELQNAMNKASEDALQAYSLECKAWLKSGVKSVEIADIVRYTGHGKRKIENAITKGLLSTAPRNDKLILVSSLIEWLKNTPLSTTAPMLKLVGNEPVSDPAMMAVDPVMVANE